MAYSNGYDLAKVLPALRQRLGWRTDASLNATNETSNSGRYFDDGSFHAAVTVPHIKSVVPTPADNWDAYFTAKQDAAIIKSLQSVFNKTEFFEKTYLYENKDIGLDQLIANSGKAVGWRIEMIKRMDVSCKVNSLQLYFDGVATFNVRLYKQGDNTPLKTQSVTTSANTKTSVTLTDWILNYAESPVYYIVYFQDDLGIVKAIQEQAYQCDTLMVAAESFIADTTGTNFDRVQQSYSTLPYGLNLNISTFRDFTENIINQPFLFDELIGLTMASTVVEDILYSTESAAKERILKDQFGSIGLRTDLTGAAPVTGAPKTEGLKQRLAAEAQRVANSFYYKPKARTVNVAHQNHTGWY